MAAAIVDAAYQIHRAIGPGLLESVYEAILARELALRGFEARTQVAMPLRYRGQDFDEAYRVDVLVADCVIVEVKSVVTLHRVHKKQLLTYLRLSNVRLGLLLNFGAERMKQGITRIVNGLPES